MAKKIWTITALFAIVVAGVVWSFKTNRAPAPPAGVNRAAQNSAATSKPWRWQATTNQAAYMTYLGYPTWAPITMPRLKSFGPEYNLVEKETAGCLEPKTEDLKKYLRAFGGLCPHEWWLEAQGKAGVVTIANKKALFAYLNHSPAIQNASQAAALVGLTDFVDIDKNDVVRGQSLSLNSGGGYLLDIFGADVCNDGDLPEQLYHVSAAGDVEIVATIPRKTPICSP